MNCLLKRSISKTSYFEWKISLDTNPGSENVHWISQCSCFHFGNRFAREFLHEGQKRRLSLKSISSTLDRIISTNIHCCGFGLLSVVTFQHKSFNCLVVLVCYCLSSQLELSLPKFSLSSVTDLRQLLGNTAAELEDRLLGSEAEFDRLSSSKPFIIDKVSWSMLVLS